MGQAGFQIGSYSVLSRLGAGGMGEVWLATRGGRQCVVKTLLPHLAEDSRVREMFIKEGKVASMISDPSVVQIYELGSSGGQYFMALEYVDGTSLDRLVALKQKLPHAVAAYVAARAAAGLQAIHEQRHPETGDALRIVHRDISPSNLLLSLDGEVKVADFGIAKTFTTDPGGSTTVGTAKGKIAYMSPEQARGKQVDQRTDVFALGVVLYELIAGDIPYHRTKNDYEMLAQVVYGRGRPLKQLAPSVPSTLAGIVAKAMALDAEQRWQSAREVRVALEEWLATAGGPGEARAELHVLVSSVREEHVTAPRQETKGVEVNEVSPSMIVPAHVTPQTVNVRAPVAEQTLPEESLGVAEPAAAVETPAPVRRKKKRRAWLALSLGVLALAFVGWGVSRVEPGGTAPVEVQLPPAGTMQVRVPAPVPLAPSEVQPIAAAAEPEAARPKAVRTTKRSQAKAADEEEKTVALETVPPVDVYFGNTLLGRSPVAVPADAEMLRLVSAADGIDFTVKMTGEGPVKIVVPRASLHVRVDPWAEVTLDGRAVGMTPLPPATVYAGRHVIDLVNEELKVRRRVEVVLSAGETKVVREKL